MTFLHSPNFGSRQGQKVSLLVMHYTGMQSAEEAISRLCNKDAQVSAHYVIDEKGKIYHLVQEADCAWHAGHSYWRGYRNVNPISIGIEIVNPGHEFGYRLFPEIQMEAVVALSKDIISRHEIPARNVIGHSDIAPERKRDPGELFDWKWLAGQGIGLWSEAINEASGFKHGVLEMQAKLAQYGYDVPQNGIMDQATCKVIVAFQRHFRPGNIRGEWDEECSGLLEMLFLAI
jgi:N-acetylmuramoyl-L-alanine amidase